MSHMISQSEAAWLSLREADISVASSLTQFSDGLEVRGDADTLELPRAGKPIEFQFRAITAVTR